MPATKLYYGSIDISKLLEHAKQGHKAFSRAQNGKIYLNINVWVNDQPDQFGNDASIQATFKDAPKEEKFYCGNLKESDYNGAQPLGVNAEEIPDSDDDLPF